MGSVTPLLAVSEALQSASSVDELFWIGTANGPERQVVTDAGITFQPISGGKVRRYFSLQNFLDPFRIIYGCIQSLALLHRLQPEVVVSAGSFIAVPVVFSAWLLRIPVVVHQQDCLPGLANKLSAPFAQRITVALAESLPYFNRIKTVWIGNPVRQSILTGSRASALHRFGLDSSLPTVLVIGGGTGATVLNQLVADSLSDLTAFCQIIHVTGAGKSVVSAPVERYHPYEFLQAEMPDALAVADVVVSRAGFGFLSELAALGKPTVVIPLPQSHQEANAVYFAHSHAAVYLPQSGLDSAGFVAQLKALLDNPSDRDQLSRNIKSLLKPGATQALLAIIRELTNKG